MKAIPRGESASRVFNAGNSDGLPENRILELRETRDGSLWLLTERGHVTRFRDGQFVTLAPSAA